MSRPASSFDLVPIFFEGAVTVESLREILAPAGLVVRADKAGRLVVGKAPAFIARDVHPVALPRVAPFAQPERAPVIAMRRKAR